MKRVLVAPLDWGLGHATRCIPIITSLKQKGCEVILAGSGDSLALLKEEFPTLQGFSLPAYDPRYPANGSMVFAMLKQLPKFLKTIRDEHQRIDMIILAEKIDIIISDNRYGCWSARIPSVFITHQSNIMMPKRFGVLSGLIRRMNVRYMKKFTACWVPDFPEPHALAGALISFGKIKPPLHVEHIGPLSRFVIPDMSAKKAYDVMAIFSGPEPQRTALENVVRPQLERSGLKYYIVRGVLSASPISTDIQADFLNSSKLLEKIVSSDLIIARSGYSTIMDMAALNKKTIFIPTPGQTEQEYLAKRLMQKQIAFSMPQHTFDLTTALTESRRYTGFTGWIRNSSALNDALDKLLNHKDMAHHG